MHLLRMIPYLCVTALCSVAFFSPAASARPSTHGAHPPMPNQEFRFECRVADDGERVLADVSIELPMASVPADLDQVVVLPDPFPAVRFAQYLSNAQVEQEMQSDGDGRPAVRLSVEGPRQSHQRWLLAGDAAHDRLVSFIGTWRYMEVEDRHQRDDLLEQFRTEFTRAPRLIVSRSDGSGRRDIPVDAGSTLSLDGPSCTVRAEAFFEHFAMDNTTGQPVNRSKQRLNPAVQVELDCDGVREERWIFAKFPGFSRKEPGSIPLRVTLDYPIEHSSEMPDFVLVTVAGARHEVWSRFAGEIVAKALKINEAVPVGASQYTFHVSEFVSTGRFVERYRVGDQTGGRPAFKDRVETTPDDVQHAWLEVGKRRTIPTTNGRLTVAVFPGTAGTTGAHP